MSKEKDTLMSFEKERLADLIINLMEGLEEGEKIQFISKYIDPKLALESIETGGEENFLKEARKFCKGCLNRDYYIEPDYNDYWDSYNEEVFDGCKWAEIFTTDFNLAIMYSRNGDYDIAFDAFEHLLECIYKAGYDEEMLGTDSPENYIKIDWNDAFEQYYICIKNCIKDKIEVANKAFEVWINFGERCTEHILEHIDDLESIEKIIRKNMGDSSDWTSQHLFFELLKNFYERYNSGFDEVKRTIMHHLCL